MKKNNKQELFDKLNFFIKKYYINLLIKGVIYALSLLLGFAILLVILEYFNQFNVLFRTSLFWVFIVFSSIVLFKYILVPLLQINKIGKTISYEEAAKIIGEHFSEIQDKILNVIQLNQMNPELNDLVYASIEQKISKIKPISFVKAIDLRNNKIHLKWLVIPIGVISIFLITGKHYVLTDSYARIINHSTFFEPSAPFDYLFINDKLESVQYEDFILKIAVVGEMLPKKVFLILDDNELRLNSKEPHTYEHVFKSLKSDITFRLFAEGYYSSPYTIKILPKPKILDFSVHIRHPKYTAKKSIKLKNVGDFKVPEGANVKWIFQTKNTQSISLEFNDQNLQKKIEENVFFEKILSKSTPYKVKVFNTFSLEDSLLYHAEVIPDQFPKIEVKKLDSSASAKYIFEGKIEDDYALTKLTFNLLLNDLDSVYSEEIEIKKLSKELFYYVYDFKNIPIAEKFSYYFEVWDNDGFNGHKSSKSKIFSFTSATEEELYIQKDEANLEIKSSLQNSINAAKNLKKKIEKLNKNLIEKKELSWQEKEKIKNLLEEHKELQAHIEKMKEKSKENLARQKRLNSSILEKERKLQELMEKVMDKEMEDLMKELEKMLTETNKEKIKDLLEKIDKSNTNLEKELERELEIFKALEFEQKLEKSIDDLKRIKEKQEALKKNTEEKNINLDSLYKEQENIQNDFENLKKDLKILEEKNNSLENSHDLPKTKENEERATKNINESKDLLKKGKEGNSKKSQKKAIQNFESLLNQLEDLKSSCSSDAHEENLESLRQILDNLIILSFDQEDLIKQTNQISKNSSEFLSVVRAQKKLADNIEVIEDSLFALSKRVVQIQKIVNKEISAINNDMKKSTQELENRQIGKATKRQQFVMTSINNLALLLSEMLEQMQKELANKTPGEKQCNKPGSGKPSLNELKKAQEKLNQQIKKRKNGKKGTGEGNAMELLSLVKTQEAIRKRLEELRNELGDSEKDKIDKLIHDMQENELDIVRQEIDKETIERQKEILVRLLEFEKAEKEQGENEKKESIEWILKEEDLEKEVLDYEKIKRDQEELIKSTPIELTPFYRKKVNEYFNNLLIKEK